MASRNAVTLTFAGDTKSLDRSFAGVETGLKDVGKSYDSAAKHADGFADSAEGVTKNTRGGKDVLDGFSDSMEALGVTLPGPIGNIAGLAGGVADMADGMGTLAAPAIAKMSAAMKAMNLTFLTSPVFLIIAGIVALSVALVVAYKKSEKFREIVHGALDGVRAVTVAVGDAFKWMADKAVGALRWIGDTAKWLWDHTPLGMLINNVDKIAGVVGKVGGAVGGLFHAKGGQIDGLSVVGERGPELFAGKGTVIPNGRLGGGGGETRVVLEFGTSGDPIFEAFKKQIRVRGGLETALGSR